MYRRAVQSENILKGAMLLAVWSQEVYRVTHDADLLKFGNEKNCRNRWSEHFE